MTTDGRIGRYHIVEQIAAGGQATVYRAQDDALGRQVAVKVLHAHLSGEPGFRERFLREAKTAARLNHSNIVVIHEVGEDAGRHFIAMEHLPETLQDMLRRRGALPWREALEIVRQVAGALQAAHGRGVIHRDLKPPNVLRSSTGVWKVSDFGIARAAEFATITATGTVLGTPQYMSPEQARGADLDARADLFSLGVILHELLTGHTPLEGRTPQAVVHHHLAGRPLPLQRLKELAVPSSVVDMVRRLTASDLKRRYPDARALIADIDTLLTERPAASRPQAPDAEGLARNGRAAQGGQPSRSGPRLAAWTVLLLSVGVVAAIVGVPRLDDWFGPAEAGEPTLADPGVQEGIFEDPSLEEAVRSALGKQEGEITPQGLAGLTALDARERGITSLTGLEHATGLLTLHLEKNQIRDLSPLSRLTQLQELGLDQNQVHDVAPLSGLTGLQRLYLTVNQVRDVTPLSRLTGLQSLSLNRNQVRDLGPLASLTGLQWLFLDDNQVRDLTPLSGLTGLKGLFLPGNHVQDLAPLAGLVGLQEISLSGNQIQDLRPLAGLSPLTKLLLDNNQVRDLSPLSGLTRLEHLDVRENQVSDLSPLSDMIRLAYLDVGGNEVADLGPLSRLTALKYLYFWKNRVSDLGPLSGLSGVVDLAFWDNQVRDLTPLSGLTRLEGLDLGGNRVSDLAPLSGLTHITRLWFWNNEVEDIGPLEGLTGLDHLDFRSNRVRDLTPLSALTRLRYLDFGGNQVSDLRPLSDLASLRYLYFWGNAVTDLSPLASLTAIGQMDFANNRVRDLTPLSGLTALLRLYLGANDVTDVTPLASLTDLRALLLDDNRIADVTPLSQLTKLGQNPPSLFEREGVAIHLGLEGNDIADIQPLVDNPALAAGAGVDLRNNPLNADAFAVHLPALQARGVKLLHNLPS